MDEKNIADVQNLTDTRQIAIDKVGIKDIRYPIFVKDLSRGVQHTVATFNMYVQLPEHFKGTHMSRFVAILNNEKNEVSIENFPQMLREMVEKLEAKSGFIEMTFPYFIRKQAPISGVESLMDYDVTFLGSIENGNIDFSLKVIVPVTSLCPCSKKISDYGAHNQRSHVTVTIKSKKNVWIEEVVALVEKEASSELYSLLKRPDEKFVTERAYDHPKFVEDMVRDVAGRLNGEKRIVAYRVESENFESIHNHSAYAMIESGII